MRQQFTIAKFILATAVAAVALVRIAGARAPSVEVADQVPDRYTVQKGDTLWGISGKFLKDPWRWPEIWRMNRDQIRNPHLIYPGDVVVLDHVDGQRQLSLERPATRLSPTVRVDAARRRGDPVDSAGRHRAVSVVAARHRTRRPRSARREIVAGRDARTVVRGDGDIVYVVGHRPEGGRPTGTSIGRGRDSRRSTAPNVLGYEQRFLGTARSSASRDVSTVRIDRRATRKSSIGDRLRPGAARDSS